MTHRIPITAICSHSSVNLVFSLNDYSDQELARYDGEAPHVEELIDDLIDLNTARPPSPVSCSMAPARFEKPTEIYKLATGCHVAGGEPETVNLRWQWVQVIQVLI